MSFSRLWSWLNSNMSTAIKILQCDTDQCSNSRVPLSEIEFDSVKYQQAKKKVKRKKGRTCLNLLWVMNLLPPIESIYNCCTESTLRQLRSCDLKWNNGFGTLFVGRFEKLTLVDWCWLFVDLLCTRSKYMTMWVKDGPWKSRQPMRSLIVLSLFLLARQTNSQGNLNTLFSVSYWKWYCTI